jgi:hypothetical protein
MTRRHVAEPWDVLREWNTMVYAWRRNQRLCGLGWRSAERFFLGLGFSAPWVVACGKEHRVAALFDRGFDRDRSGGSRRLDGGQGQSDQEWREAKRRRQLAFWLALRS